MYSLPMNVDDRGDNEVEKKLETSKLMQRTPCPCYCYQKDRFLKKTFGTHLLRYHVQVLAVISIFTQPSVLHWFLSIATNICNSMQLT